MHLKMQWHLVLPHCCQQWHHLLATSHCTDRRRHLGVVRDRTQGQIPAPATTSVQVVEAVIHLHERVVENTQMRLDVLHPLPMLMHELIEAVLCRTSTRHTLFQTLERLVGLVELDG